MHKTTSAKFNDTKLSYFHPSSFSYVRLFVKVVTTARQLNSVRDVTTWRHVASNKIIPFVAPFFKWYYLTFIFKLVKTYSAPSCKNIYCMFFSGMLSFLFLMKRTKNEPENLENQQPTNKNSLTQILRYGGEA